MKQRFEDEVEVGAESQEEKEDGSDEGQTGDDHLKDDVHQNFDVSNSFWMFSNLHGGRLNWKLKEYSAKLECLTGQ